MSADLLTEEQARQLASPDALILREGRGVFDYVLWIVFSAATLAGLFFPFWRQYLPKDPDFPSFLAVGGGLFCWLFSGMSGADLKAARQPGSWRLISGTNALFVNFRSYHHWKWPKEDKIVLRLSPLDVDYIQPVEGSITVGNGKSRRTASFRRLELYLRDPLEQAILEAITRENLNTPPGFNSRYGHSPLQASADGRVLALEFGRLTPGFSKIQELLRSRYRVQPVVDVRQSVSMTTHRVPFTPERQREVEMLLAAGDKIGAIKLLRNYTGLGLKEAKDMLEQGRMADLTGKQP